MPQIKKILFPVDFSESSCGAARYVEALAGRFEATILLLHIVGMGERALAEELLPGRKAELEKFLADELRYFDTERVCVIGDDPAANIVETARTWCADLVMMPTHGIGVFRRALLGSATAKVLHDLETPVWTSAHTETAPPLEAIHCRRILCALDLSPRSREVLKWASELAGEYQAEVGIVHAVAPLPPAYYGTSLEEEFAKSVSEQATRRIETLQAAVGTKGRVFVETGDPAEIVSAAASDFNADLLIMGRHGAKGIGGFLRPNAYAILRESPCPVISI